MQKHNKKELPHGDSPMYSIVHLTYDRKAFIFIHFYERVNFTIFCYCYRSPPVLHGPGSKKKVQLVGAAGCLSGAAKKHALRIVVIETFSFVSSNFSKICM